MRADDQDTREFYTQPGVMTSPGEHAALLKDLPDDPAALAAVLHGLVIHEHMVGGYGVTLSEADRRTVHVRRAGDLRRRSPRADPRPLDVARSPQGGCPATAALHRADRGDAARARHPGPGAVRLRRVFRHRLA